MKEEKTMHKAEKKPIAAKSQSRIQPHLLPAKHPADFQKNRESALIQTHKPQFSTPLHLPLSRYGARTGNLYHQKEAGQRGGRAGNRKILIVDDDESMQEYLKKILEFNGFDVLETWHPQEAIDYVKKHHPVLALVDVDLGYGTSGIELCKQMRDAQDGWPMKVVLISGHADTPYKIAGYSCGAIAFLLKPFSAGELIALINAQLNENLTNRNDSKISPAQANEWREGKSGKLEKCGFSVSLSKMEICYEGKPIKEKLTLIEYKILLVLLKHSPNVVYNHTFIKEVWGNEVTPEKKIDINAIRVHICRLKRKLPRDVRKKIVSERKDGYRLGVR